MHAGKSIDFTVIVRGKGLLRLELIDAMMRDFATMFPMVDGRLIDHLSSGDIQYGTG
jgi:hypothetical protein